MCVPETCEANVFIYSGRGCSPNKRFSDNLDGTISDNCTGLMWQKATADINLNDRLDDQDKAAWCEALEYCDNLELAGHVDWRLPNVKELESILSYAENGPFFPFEWNGTVYWTSTSNVEKPEEAFQVADHGFIQINGKPVPARVRAVRG